MTDDERRQFESIRELSDQAWRSIAERRNYEWKVVTVFWSAIAIGIAGSLTLASFPLVPGGRASVVCVAAVFILLFIRWVVGLGKANNADRAIALFYERKLQILSHAEFDDELVKILSKQRSGMGRLTDWA